ncbi:MAG: hypothetical protein ACR2PJ_00335, partial [Pseudomonadales bacterium]
MGEQMLGAYLRLLLPAVLPAILFALLFAMFFAKSVYAYESDQHLHRAQPVKDSLTVLDDYVNKALEEILSKRSPPRTKREVIVAIYFKIGGWHWADKIERWAA